MNKIIVAIIFTMLGMSYAYAGMVCSCSGTSTVETLPDGSVKYVCNGTLSCQFGTIGGS